MSANGLEVERLKEALAHKGLGYTTNIEVRYEGFEVRAVASIWTTAHIVTWEQMIAMQINPLIVAIDSCHAALATKHRDTRAD